LQILLFFALKRAARATGLVIQGKLRWSSLGFEKKLNKKKVINHRCCRTRARARTCVSVNGIMGAPVEKENNGKGAWMRRC